MNSLRSLLDGKRILVTGGTGSLGKVLVEKLLSFDIESLRVFSRDEAKQYLMSRMLQDPRLQFRIGDIRSLGDVTRALDGIDIVFNAAALKQVPTCEYAPFQAVQTNIHGAENIVNAIAVHHLPVKVVVGISTDKACKPVNVMGMTKAIQERIFINGNLVCPSTRFVCSRYGNVLASRGSLIPLFHEQIRAGRALTVTSERMTRFLMNLDEAASLVVAAAVEAEAGETYIPQVSSAMVVHIAEIFSEISGRPVEVVGERPGEKLHEILVSEEEASRTYLDEVNKRFVIGSCLPELHQTGTIRRDMTPVIREFSSGIFPVTKEALRERLEKESLLPGQVVQKNLL